MSRLAYVLSQSWLVLVAAFVSGFLMAATDAGLAGRIGANRAARLSELMAGLLPEASSFSRIDQPFELTGKKGRPEPVAVYKAIGPLGECLGWAFVASGPGFNDQIELIVAVDAKFRTLASFKVLTCNETPGFGDKIRDAAFQGQFAGAPAGDLELTRFGDRAAVDRQIVAITGATVTSRAVVELLNKTLASLRKQMAERGLIGDDQRR